MKIFIKVLLGITTLFLIAVLLVGCTGLRGNQKPVDKDPVDVVDPNPGQEKILATVYFADEQGMYLVPEEVTIVKDNRSLAVLLVEQLISGPTEQGHGVVIPPETKLLSLEIVDGIAYVNFSVEAKTKHWGGTTGEMFTVYSVVNTMAQLPEVDKVQFLIEGEKEESIWGHGYTMEPFEPSQGIIDPAYR